MSNNVKLKQGFDIKLVGKATESIAKDVEAPKRYALKPEDFPGMIRPKSVVKVGAKVKAGDPILIDGKQEEIKYTSPVSGEIVEIQRGERRKLLAIVVEADSNIEYKEFPVKPVDQVSVEDAKAVMLESGVWPLLVRRPYAIVADPSDQPRAIFVSSFDSHPLAPNYEFTLQGQEAYIQAGVDVLKKFAPKVYVGLNGTAPSKLFDNVAGVEKNKFNGPHPAGNVGVQIHHTSPIANANDVVWTISPQGLAQIGKLFKEGKYDAKQVIAVAGPKVDKPEYVETYVGASVDTIAAAKIKGDDVRVVSGNILTGSAISKDGFIGFYSNMVTALAEGKKSRFFLTDGWLAPITSRLSFHKAFGLLGSTSKEYALDTNTNGQDRPFAVTGAFEKVVPMDIYPMYLLKSILAYDYENMEALGIYEVAEEDFALCEFIDVSKHDIQKIVRQGLDTMRLD
ncbi:Na(+)-translocating NADH-quinone reductase subunit A [Flammeovirga yaeyamensis]|uniref:Na(+)-translocating NADH-quinone reductase subunit A n=1 Tax=Flammeovirga yaeyamensis TaxID=367791 RepID=A0AAX1NAW9_9BACT|nr:Na(+)-translocating NADH-quinone reductase subunit A [Flammeovirga yaeyamensis]NMF35618.1 Na(+)-translocating NADH-quinone reductase subunit A [Flammeovirga yaeyamensis]QWG03425.1 Na(+)-translocating NADH-quinone reductase subunit A [Flammeovirga yaeyamensis]